MKKLFYVEQFKNRKIIIYQNKIVPRGTILKKIKKYEY